MFTVQYELSLQIRQIHFLHLRVNDILLITSKVVYDVKY